LVIDACEELAEKMNLEFDDGRYIAGEVIKEVLK
jgi:hypothetical protein